MKMKRQIVKWGNSASVRIPAKILRAARLSLGAEIEVRESRGQIIISPRNHTQPSLRDLLARITPDNQQPLVVFDGAVSRSIRS